MEALLDADLIAYRSAASAELEEEFIAIARCDENIRQILAETGATKYRGFLSGGMNFRKELDPQYKANRTQPKPRHLMACQAYLVEKWGIEITDGIEADDALGINQHEDSVICSLDKDLLQIPGKHYQWQISGTVKGKQWIKEAKWYDVTYFDGLKTFYASSLIGDTSDNIVGVDGLGPKKSNAALANCGSEQQLFDTCRALYSNDERYFLNLKLLWVLRVEGGIFDEKPLLDESQSTQLHSECVEGGQPEVASEIPSP